MKANIKASIELTKSLLSVKAGPLICLLGISLFININGEDIMQAATAQEESLRYSVQLLMGLWELIEGVLLILLLSQALPDVHRFKAKDMVPSPFKTAHLMSFFAEYLRMLAKILRWGILFLIPGFVRYAQLIFVPYIALFSKRYRNGEVDALQLSTSLVKGRLWTIMGILLGMIVLQAVVEFAPQLIESLHTVVFRAVFGAVGFLISVWAYSLMFVLFENFLLDEEG
jgi:hypothetical protein